MIVKGKRTMSEITTKYFIGLYHVSLKPKIRVRL